MILLRALREASKKALSGKIIYNGFNEKALTTNFELLNLVPIDHNFPLKSSENVQFNAGYQQQQQKHTKTKRSIKNSAKFASNGNQSAKWRRVGLVSASSVRLDTIVWPGGDIVVSGKYTFDF